MIEDEFNEQTSEGNKEENKNEDNLNTNRTYNNTSYILDGGNAGISARSPLSGSKTQESRVHTKNIEVR